MSPPGLPAINAATRLCAVLGRPVAHSASPAMHNAAFQAVGLNWCYLAFEVDPAHLRAAIEGARALNIAGFNLTVPHKLLAVKMMDALDPSAKLFGAVNTIKFERINGKIRTVGYNTDAEGMATALLEDLNVRLRGSKVLLLGAGGAGKTAAVKLAGEGVAELRLVNRTAAKAEQLAKEIRKRFPSVRVATGYPGGTIDLVLNATSLGLKSSDPSPLDERQFKLGNARAVYDMIYRPPRTRLLAAAKKAGCKTANGLGMLLHQGARAFEIWTGRPAPVEVMRKALECAVCNPIKSRK
ncbi:MAG: shikimate dehydrogenase [Limisphaerales bacterium]